MVNNIPKSPIGGLTKQYAILLEKATSDREANEAIELIDSLTRDEIDTLLDHWNLPRKHNRSKSLELIYKSIYGSRKRTAIITNKPIKPAISSFI